MQEGKRLKGSERLIGDVVISVDRARIQARQFSNTLKRELALYVIHGLLHLAGYRDGSKKMKRCEQGLLGEFF
jgi:probable rRNA maturation factor